MLTIEQKIKRSLSRHFRSKVSNKKLSYTDYLGCNIKEFLIYLESTINQFNQSCRKWKRKISMSEYGKTWEIDHIIPMSKFRLNNESHIAKCFHYTNLQALGNRENRAKSNNHKSLSKSEKVDFRKLKWKNA